MLSLTMTDLDFISFQPRKKFLTPAAAATRASSAAHATATTHARTSTLAALARACTAHAASAETAARWTRGLAVANAIATHAAARAVGAADTGACASSRGSRTGACASSRGSRTDACCTISAADTASAGSGPDARAITAADTASTASGTDASCVRAAHTARTALTSAQILARRILTGVVAARGSTEPLCRSSISIGSAAPMLRVVLPSIAVSGVPVPSVEACVAVVVVDEGVIVIDGDVVAAPAAVPSPAASAPSRANRYSEAERDCASRYRITRRIVHRWIGIVRGRAPDSHRVVCWHVDYLGACLLNHDHALVLGSLGFHSLLLVRLQLSGISRPDAHSLHGVHQVALLREKGVADLIRPFDVLGHVPDDIGERRHGLHTGIPPLLLYCLGDIRRFQVLVLFEPLAEFDDLQGISRSNQNLAEEVIGIQRDRRYQ
jgi:hypothetical protein